MASCPSASYECSAITGSILEVRQNAMALAIKTLTAKHAYGDITTAFTDGGRPGTMENCQTCGAQFVLYYGQRLEEDAAIAWLQGVLRGICPAHNGWLAVDEQPPVPPEDHRRRIERAIAILRQHVAADAVPNARRSMRWTTNLARWAEQWTTKSNFCRWLSRR
jgi:hypothetical protein